MIAEAPQGSIAAYVISMAKTPSDVLAVHLLLKEAGIGFAMPVAPLFETLDDLEQRQRCHDPAAEYRLVSRPDSGQTDGDDWLFRLSKDAGVMAASPAQYQAQDALIKTCEKRVLS